MSNVEVKQVLEERNRSHGDYRVNFCHTANLWAAYLQIHPAKLSPLDVAQMMVVFKTSRAKVGHANHADHYVDQQGYAALASKIATAMEKEEILLIDGIWTVMWERINQEKA